MFKKYIDRIEKLEMEVGVYEKKEVDNSLVGLFDKMMNAYASYPYETSLKDQIKSLRDDFKELDKKFDHLERYLQIEYVKTTTENQTYDWANKKQTEGFVKCEKTYEQFKKIKETPSKDDDRDDD